MATIVTRMGDGYSVEMTAEEVREDLLAGVADAARRGKIAPQPRRSRAAVVLDTAHPCASHTPVRMKHEGARKRRRQRPCSEHRHRHRSRLSEQHRVRHCERAGRAGPTVAILDGSRLVHEAAAARAEQGLAVLPHVVDLADSSALAPLIGVVIARHGRINTQFLCCRAGSGRPLRRRAQRRVPRSAGGRSLKEAAS